MERDPIRLAWRAAPARHVTAIALLILGACLLAAVLGLIGSLADALNGSLPHVLLRLALPWPSVFGGPLVLFPGFRVEAGPWILGSLGLLALCCAMLGAVLLGINRLALEIGSRALERVRGRIAAAILEAPVSAAEDALDAARIAGAPLERERAALGHALLGPLRQGLMLAVLLGFMVLTDWHLAAATLAVLAAGYIIDRERIAARGEAALARHDLGAAAQEAFETLLRRAPAVRAHGTALIEKQRIAKTMEASRAARRRREAHLLILDSAAALAFGLAPLAVLGVAAWAQSADADAVIVSSLAAALAALSVRSLGQWRQGHEQARAILAQTSNLIGSLRPNRPAGSKSLPLSGTLEASGVSAYDPASGARVAEINFSIPLPSYVAVTGDDPSGPRLLAALIAGQIAPSTGRIALGETGLSEADPAERLKRIGFAGGEPVLVEGSLRENLLYGLGEESDREGRLAEAITAAGLEDFIHERGLAGTVDPDQEPALAAALVEARRAVREALARDGLDRYVDSFDAARYNHHATVGENLLFGQPVGDTFHEAHLASHPFVRAILEAEDLAKPLSAMGLSIAGNMVEIFADIPDGHPLFQRFSFFAAGDRSYFEDLVARRRDRRRISPRDTERLVGLALRYSESRHRLGLLNESLRERLLTARTSFARMLPASLAASIEFYDPTRLCRAASILDNLLFGRIAADQAGAQEAIRALIAHVLTARELDDEVARIGLSARLDPQADDLSPSRRAAIDLARCLARRPAILVVERAFDGLAEPAAQALAARLRRAMAGRSLFIAAPSFTPAMATPPFDAVIRFRRGTAVLEGPPVRERAAE